MNENLNLVEILKDCPKGTKLYSIIHGEVEFEEVIINDHYPIKYKFIDKDSIYGMDRTTADGRHFSPSYGECTLFPSKDQRDWSKFKVEPEMVDGEIYYCSFVNNVYDNSIYIYSKTTMCKTEYYVKLNLFDLTLYRNAIITTIEENIKELRKATNEEKEMFFKIIEENGQKWDADRKELIRIEKKFDISTLQPFNKVLVRDNNTQIWKCDFFDSYINGVKLIFRTIHCWYSQCIPYNNETKHLRGTNKLPLKKYITWEE